MTTLLQKTRISLGSALLFVAVNLQQTYGVTDKLSPLPLIEGNCPTGLGLLLHALVFFVLSFATMGNPLEMTGLKVKFSLYGTLIMFLLSSPAMYTLTGSLLGSQIASNGCPTLNGVLLHGALYALCLVLVMYLPDEG